MEAYQERYLKEREELAEKTEKLNAILFKWEEGRLDFELNCPINLLVAQSHVMEAYLAILDERAKYEGIGG